MERPDVREDSDRSGGDPVAAGPGDSGATDADGPGATDADRPDSPREAMARIRDHAETVRRRELDEAVGRLEARGSLTDEQHAVLAATTERLVARLLAPAEEGLYATAAADDPEAARAVRRLFGD